MKKVIPLIIAIGLVIFALFKNAKMQKDDWTTESPETKYSEQRENEVWGKILRGDNSGLFYGTPLYEVADAMSGFPYFRSQKKIEKFIDGIPKHCINFQEGKYGESIGHFALTTNNLFVIRKLLDKGLNPNLMDKLGNAIIIYINGLYSNLPESLQTLKYMIKKGANVNLYSEKAHSSTPLIQASRSGNLEFVKILVKAGADPNFIDKLGYAFKSPLSSALISGRIKIVNYLIFDQKVDFRTLKYPKDSKFHPDEYEILYQLRGEMMFKLNSKEYQEKMKLVSYLKTQGLDYWKTPIPDKVRNNPNYTQEYLSKY